MVLYEEIEPNLKWRSVCARYDIRRYTLYDTIYDTLSHKHSSRYVCTQCHQQKDLDLDRTIITFLTPAAAELLIEEKRKERKL